VRSEGCKASSPPSPLPFFVNGVSSSSNPIAALCDECKPVGSGAGHPAVRPQVCFWGRCWIRLCLSVHLPHVAALPVPLLDPQPPHMAVTNTPHGHPSPEEEVAEGRSGAWLGDGEFPARSL